MEKSIEMSAKGMGNITTFALLSPFEKVTRSTRYHQGVPWEGTAKKDHREARTAKSGGFGIVPLSFATDAPHSSAELHYFVADN